MAHADSCFHCALPIPAGCKLTVRIDNDEQPVCCPGCKAVAELILDSGMSNYYKLREAPQPGTGKPRDDVQNWQVFNSDDMLRAFTISDDEQSEATIYAGGMYCSACSWLIETSLNKLPGIKSVAINPVTHRLRVRWSPDTIGLGDILAELARIGYEPQPLTSDDTTKPEVAEQRTALKRLLVASLGMMQVMMFAVGLYAGDFQGIDADMRRFLRLVSFLVTTPVVFYAAKPFFSSAWRGLAARMPGMDLPVSIAIGAAYSASTYATYVDGPAVWFDSVTMFVFFLTLGRYLEMRARHRAIDQGDALAQAMPNTATRIEQGEPVAVPVSMLAADDIVLVRSGESVPADGVVIKGTTSVDESLLTGESTPQQRTSDDHLAAGSINLDGIVEMRVQSTGNDTALGAISRLSERARFARPTFVRTADRIASHFVIALLVVAVAVAVGWTLVAPERAFVITLSVLVVTCPCALSLATPAAFATAGSRLAQLQLLLTNGNAIETLSAATHFVFDKTGTLTRGMPVIDEIDVCDDRYDREECLRIAVALEQVSTHPIAKAFHTDATLPTVSDAMTHVAQGVSGTIDGQHWQLGSATFAHGDAVSSGASSTLVFLAVAGQCVAKFHIKDQLRTDALDTLNTLHELGIQVSLASGDNERAVANAADELGITDSHFACTPDDKLTLIETMQANGARVIMVGDGINDAPVLAGADASIALGHGALLAQTHADIILLGDSLQPLTTAVRMARRTMRIVRQNLVWAVVYNATAMPLAAAGAVPPWLAAIGMSVSSLVVVLNALRLNRFN